MKNKIKCSILTPDRVVYEEEVDYIVVPAYDGEMGFLHNHTPLVSELIIGEVKLHTGQGIEYIAIHGGFAELRDNDLVILTSIFGKTKYFFRIPMS